MTHTVIGKGTTHVLYCTHENLEIMSDRRMKCKMCLEEFRVPGQVIPSLVLLPHGTPHSFEPAISA